MIINTRCVRPLKCHLSRPQRICMSSSCTCNIAERRFLYVLMHVEGIHVGAQFMPSQQFRVQVSSHAVLTPFTTHCPIHFCGFCRNYPPCETRERALDSIVQPRNHGPEKYRTDAGKHCQRDCHLFWRVRCVCVEDWCAFRCCVVVMTSQIVKSPIFNCR